MAGLIKNNNEWNELWWPAPAKLNLMLNIVGQRADGYHELQTVFQLLAINDWLNFTPSDKNEIELNEGSSEIPVESNLITRAAKLLKESSGTQLGVKIDLKKILPMGAGLGGGSSDAATTLLVLNKLWSLDYSNDELAALGLQLGADVPVFVQGKSAWAEGVGERITPIELPECWFVVVNSGIHLSTREVFAHNSLTRDNAAITIRDFLSGQVSNDCLPVVRKMSRELDDIYQQFSQFKKVFLTGTGSSLFAKCDTRPEAVLLTSQLPNNWTMWVVRGQNESPVHKSLKQFFNQVD
ncbi:MAG: 4-(cytidine 5'-diphospho)-2-C-methyl-D-erythritol kinase [Cycloclasticus sp.]|nr:MAG: 4-(cytidine 5'-diphospho)-2-C-methyl-D-erythritol kinase [Cycloclasticus sp.]